MNVHYLWLTFFLLAYPQCVWLLSVCGWVYGFGSTLVMHMWGGGVGMVAPEVSQNYGLLYLLQCSNINCCVLPHPS